MSQLHLLQDADDILTRVQESLPHREGTKLLVYGLSGVIKNQDIEDLCHTATKVYSKEVGDDCEDPTFVIPAPQNLRLAGSNVQEVLNKHVASLEDIMNVDNGQQENNIAIFPFAFVVIESTEWRRHGVTVVLLDSTFDPDDDWNDRPPEGFWWADECETSVVALGGLCCDVVMEMDDWHNIKECQGRPTERTGSALYVSTRSRSWSPVNISTEMSRWGMG